MDADQRLTSPIAVWETVRAMTREAVIDVAEAQIKLQRFLTGAGIEVTPITVAEGNLAVTAFARFGKGRHPAQLNMSDCFAYACARSRGVPLLYKGEDFARTDIEAA